MIASSYNTTCTRTRKVAETRHAARVFGPMKPTFWNVVSCRVTHGASPCSLARHTRAGQHRGSPFALRAAARCKRATFKDKCASVRKAEQEPSVYKEEQEGERDRQRDRKTERQREIDVKENLSTKALNLDKLMDVRLIVRLLACPGRCRHGG